MTCCDNESGFPKAFVFFNRATTIGKAYQTLPTRDPVTIDILIEATATVKLYASNIPPDGVTDRWGPVRATFTASDKIIVKDEPFLYWMAEITATTGAVSVIAGA